MRRLVFDGCVYGLRRPETRYAVRYLLRKLGVEHGEMPQTVCCGAPASYAGDEAGKERHVVRAITEWERKQGAVDEVLVACPGCARAFQESPSIARRGIETTHVVELLPAAMGHLRKSGLAELEAVVTVHYPCHLTRGMGVRPEVLRRVLAAMPGIEVVEMADAEGCCGGSGGVARSDGALAREVRARKVRSALATGADLLVSACPMCEAFIEDGIREVAEGRQAADEAQREAARRIQVMSLPFLVAYAMDDFRGSLERTLAEDKERNAARRSAGGLAP